MDRFARRRRNTLILGNTGVGKSALANLLLNLMNVFTFAASAASVTKNYQFEGDESLSVGDTPGLGDTQDSQEVVRGKISEAIAACGERGVDAFLIVVDVGRFSRYHFGLLEYLFQGILGESAYNYASIVLTKCDALGLMSEADELAWLRQGRAENPALDALLDKCGNRCIFIRNPPKSNIPQVEAVYKEMREASRENLRRFVEQLPEREPFVHAAAMHAQAEFKRREDERKAKELRLQEEKEERTRQAGREEAEREFKPRMEQLEKDRVESVQKFNAEIQRIEQDGAARFQRMVEAFREQQANERRRESRVELRLPFVTIRF